MMRTERQELEKFREERRSQKALEECIPLVEGTRVAEYKSTLLKVKAHLDSKGKKMSEEIRHLIFVQEFM